VSWHHQNIEEEKIRRSGTEDGEDRLSIVVVTEPVRPVGNLAEKSKSTKKMAYLNDSNNSNVMKYLARRRRIMKKSGYRNNGS
jgi:hypothetical protein